MDSGVENRRREKASRSEGRASIAKTKWAWNEERAQGEGKAGGEERVRGQEKSRGEERARGERRYHDEEKFPKKKGQSEKRAKREKSGGEGKAGGEDRSRGQKVLKEKGRGEDRGRGQGKGRSEKQVQKEQLAKGQGKGQVDKEWVEEQGRGKERKPNQEQALGPRETGRCPVMYPPSPVWSLVRVLRALWALLAVPLALWKVWAVDDFEKCSWRVVLNKFETVGETLETHRFVEQDLLDSVERVVSTLVDSPIDPQERYLGFPYYLKVNYSCEENSEHLVRQGHLMGLKPVVLVSFQSSVNFYRWKVEQLQIQMEAAPFRSKGPCLAEEVCDMAWYTPMPIKNGSVVMRVDVSSNGVGPFIPSKRFHVNMNGYLKEGPDQKVSFTMGDELFEFLPKYFENSKSRPLRHTVEHSPVSILGGIPNEKVILLTDTNFEYISLVELNIDSCWVGAYYCPHSGFSSTIQDAISTESTLFIRQNQLVYYFTGTYNTLYDSSHGSVSWVRVLASECIKMLCPVHFQSNGSEYILALTTGKHEGYVHLGTVRGGVVTFEMLPREQSVCDKMMTTRCSIIWAMFIPADFTLLLLVDSEYSNSTRKFYQLITFALVTNVLDILYVLPEFIPDGRGLEFLTMLGTETYTNQPMIPRGMFFNPYTELLFMWGNFLLESYNMKNFIYLVDFPKESTIRYLTNSFQGDVALVTDTEEVWYLLEGSYRVYRLIPSRGWDIHFSLQVMEKNPLYSQNATMLTIFYDERVLYQLMYLSNTGRLVKRPVPVQRLLMYEGYSHAPAQEGGQPILSLDDQCPFLLMRLKDLPLPQAYTRQERYLAVPPFVLEPSGFHNENTLTIYQGLVYYLLWLHSKYDKPYADPVHDPTWRWWRNNKQDENYYFYLASSGVSADSVHINMHSYKKVYDLKPGHELPERIFLDKGNTYSFSILLTAKGHSFTSNKDLGSSFQAHSKLSLGAGVADPQCIEVLVTEKVLVNRNSVLFTVTIKDRMACYAQGISGHHLLKTSLVIKVVGSPGHCFQNRYLSTAMQGNLMLPLLIGCPPGKRLAFDITYSIEYNRQQNKHYYDCVQEDPEMPCFLFRDMFYPFFLIQDMVTGHSGSFNGSFVLKVVGGGTTQETIRDYSEEEIYRYNSPLDKSRSLIWTPKDKATAKHESFHILSHDESGIEWLCMQNSPCYDAIPRGIYAPEFFFKILVSNRDVDTTTYCDYQLVFLLHIHGLPLSDKRALLVVKVISGILVSLVILYIILSLLWPYVTRAWTHMRWRINNIITSSSYYSYSTTSSGSSGSVAQRKPKISSKVSSKEVKDRDEPAPPPPLKKSLT